MIIYSVVVLLAAAFFIHVMAIKSVKVADIFAVLSIAFALVVVVFSASPILAGDIYIFNMSHRLPPIGIVIAVDGFSLLLALLITGLGLLVGFFSLMFIKRRQPEYYTLLLLLLAGMIGFSVTGDLFNMYVFFEITSVASYGLTAWLRTKDSLEGAFKFLIIGSLGTSFILLGTALVYGLTGTLTLADIAVKATLGMEFFAALALIITGFAVKAAIMPFHAWKPDAINGTVEPVGGMFSGISTALGIYGIFRILFIFDMIRLSWVVIGFGLLTMVGGALMAFQQDNLKRLLAYSSISQIGYVVLAMGLGSIGLTPGLFHLFNNALLKVLLFLAAGIVAYHTGTRNLNNLGGLGRSLPLTAFAFGVGALGVTGIPGINGFASKFLIYLATWEVSPVLTVIALIVSTITLAYYLRAFSVVFLGPQKKGLKIGKKTPQAMLIPVVILSIICILIGFLPHIGISLVEPASSSLLNLEDYISKVLGS